MKAEYWIQFWFKPVLLRTGFFCLIRFAWKSFSCGFWNIQVPRRARLMFQKASHTKLTPLRRLWKHFQCFHAISATNGGTPLTWWNRQNRRSSSEWHPHKKALFCFQNSAFRSSSLTNLVENSGIEPLTSWLPVMRSPSWANPPYRVSQRRNIFMKLKNGVCYRLRRAPSWAIPPSASVL